jgi:hypothetical protein
MARHFHLTMWRVTLFLTKWRVTSQVGPEGILAFNTNNDSVVCISGSMAQSTPQTAAAAVAGIEFASAIHDKLLFALPDTTTLTDATADTTTATATASSDAMVTSDSNTAANNSSTSSTAIVSAATSAKSSVRPICENSATRRVAFEVCYTYFILLLYKLYVYIT